MFAAMSGAQSFSSLVLLALAYAVFWHATLPLFETLTLDHLAQTGSDYPRIRLWGSVGFVLAVLVLGPVFDLIQIDWLPLIVCVLIGGLLISAFRVPDRRHDRAAIVVDARLLDVLRRPTVVALILICFLSQLSFAPYYGFFSIYLEQHDYSRSETGFLWALGVLAEIGVFLVTGRLIRHWGARRVMLVAMASTAVRWLCLPLTVDWLPGLIVLQCLHLSSFGLYHAAAIYFIHREFRGGLHARGQALYSAASFGAGGAVGSYIAGRLWDSWSADAVFFMAGCAGMLGWAVGAAYLDRSSPDRAPLASI